MTKRDIISRLRNTLKEVNADTEYTNRYLWNVFSTVSKQIIKQDADKGKVFTQSNIWETICVSMEPVSSVLCNCITFPYPCTVYRSSIKLPKFIESTDGFIYRFIATPDMSRELVLVSPYQYSVKSKIRYHREKYAFIHDGYLFTPDLTYPQLIISGLFEEDTSAFNCNTNSDNNQSSTCGSALDGNANVPDYLIDICVKLSLQELMPSKQFIADEHPNANSQQIQGTP